MKNKVFSVNNKKSFVLFALIIVIIIGLFIVSFLKFNTIDNQKYDVKSNSNYYDEDYNFITVEQTGYTTQKINGDYYLYQKKNNTQTKENMGKNPVIFNKNDYQIYLYGLAYQVLSTGEVKTMVGQTEIPKTSPTKFYKLRDRKYLMVDSSLKTTDNSIKTTGFLIIELDKQGNATFANDEMNIKTLHPLVIKGTTMSFDIANEKLIYGKKEINLKNIIGSTNLYQAMNPKTASEDKGKEKESTEINNTTNTTNNNSYYDEYIRNVIYSINNLTGSVSEVNDKADNSIKKGEIYYDFSKYIALKNVESSVTTISVNYSVVDANNEYQSVFLIVDDNMGNTNKYYLNKNETNYLIRDLMFNHIYTLSFGYKLVSAEEEVIEDVVNIKTKSPSCSIVVSKVSAKSITYNVKISDNYKFDSGNINLYSDGTSISLAAIDMNSATTASGYTNQLYFSYLGTKNTLVLENLMYNGEEVQFDCSYRFKK